MAPTEELSSNWRKRVSFEHKMGTVGTRHISQRKAHSLCSVGETEGCGFLKQVYLG